MLLGQGLSYCTFPCAVQECAAGAFTGDWDQLPSDHQHSQQMPQNQHPVIHSETNGRRWVEELSGQ